MGHNSPILVGLGLVSNHYAMARNEEKQLARLNRYYLEKQKQEELKKRPPRPRLDTLNTPRELRKWLPTITRDIDFYVKQMEVPCYTDGKIQEFSDQIHRLKQEYRAYLRKLRALEPDISAASWANRPYANRKRQAGHTTAEEAGSSGERPEEKASPSSGSIQNFVPISTPVLQLMPSIVNQYGFEKPAPVVWNVNPETEDQPLQFGPPKTLAICPSTDTDSKKCDVSEPPSKSVHRCSGREADFGINLHESLPDGDVDCGKASSVGRERPKALDVTGHRTECGRLETETGETVTASSEHTVLVPASDSNNTLTKKVNSKLMSAVSVTDGCGSAVTNLQSNLLNLDYSDSSDENF